MITYKRHTNLNKLLKRKGDNHIEDYLPKGKPILYSSAVRLGLLDIINCLNFSENEVVLLPPVCPQGLVTPFKRKKVNCRYYHLAENFTINIVSLERLLSDVNSKVLVFIHYFGIYNHQIIEIKELCKHHNVLLIEDAVHGLFSQDQDGLPLGTIGDISIYSLPKFLPVPDGAVFIINNQDLNIKFNYKKSCKIALSRLFHLKSLLLNSLISENSNVFIYKIIKVLSLINYTVYYTFLCINNHNQDISKLSRRILSNIDYKNYIDKRKKIFNCYNDNLYHYQFKQQLPNLSGYPLIIKGGDKEAIKHTLNKNGIETISYIKGWNYIPDSDEYILETYLMNHHLLLPLNPEIPLAVYEKKIDIIKELLNL